MNQKKVIGNFGDVNAFDYGGSVLFEQDEYGQFELEHTFGMDGEVDSENKDEKVAIYGLTIYCETPEWVNAGDIELFTGQAEPKKDAPIQEWAQWYIDIAQYHGWINFDEQPFRMTEQELDNRWQV